MRGQVLPNPYLLAITPNFTLTETPYRNNDRRRSLSFNFFKTLSAPPVTSLNLFMFGVLGLWACDSQLVSL